MEIIKIDDSNYAIHQTINGIKKKCYFNIPTISSPFGVELYNNVQYINFAIDMKIPYHSQLLGDLYKLEDYIKNNLKGVEWVSSIKKNDRFDGLLKTRLLIRRNKYLTTFKIGKDYVIYDDINFKSVMSVKLCANSIWVRDGKAGVILTVEEIVQHGE